MDAEGASFERDVPVIAALGDPVRRRLYRVVASAPEPIGREDAAQLAGVAVHTAKFHLDKLAKDGLLEIGYRRLSGRTGPGSGRPAKVYRRAAREFAVSLPERQYDLLSRILATAVVEATKAGEAVAPVAVAVARKAGTEHGSSRAAEGSVEEQHTDSDLGTLTDALLPLGYEPRAEGEVLVLHNCPFHKVAQDQTELVCGLNLEFVAGVCDGLGRRSLVPELHPDPDRCCVTVRSASGHVGPSGAGR
ncbi:transcriptional regulator [Nocardioides panacihumi]|uniref:Transcriptional regulator n=1 Tax=Nocardioides panacihumi TaxID=400774 RepID=A0ABN2QVD2_9ACTN